MQKVLFVCTGNVFRSMTAEKCLNDYAKKHKLAILADSAGTGVKQQQSNPAIIERLKFYGIDAGSHRYKQISKKLIEENDIIVAMGEDHKKFIKDNFGIDTYLFNEIALGKKEPILDFHEANPNIPRRSKEVTDEVKKYAYAVIDHIYKTIPNFVENLENIVIVK